jgi:hypothetical protein
MLPQLSGSMNAGCGCCRASAPLPHSSRSASRSLWDIAVGAFSVGLWVLTPKCPVCLAAYVALWTGLGLSLTAATYVRWSLLLLSGVALGYLVVRRFARRSTRQLTLTARQL